MASRTLVLTLAVIVSTVLGLESVATARQNSPQEPNPFAALAWKTGPLTADLGGMASINIPAGFRFLGKGDAGRFMELNQNPSDGSELGVLLKDGPDSWFVVFEFSDDGYVKDDESDLDADAIISAIREGTEAANKVRRERGWATLTVSGWQQAPHYDSQTHNLTWSIRGDSEGSTSINHSTRLLGRRGVMKVNLVMSPEELGNAVPEFNALLKDFSYAPGHRYQEYTTGDRVAEYGLAGLIVGGTGVALVKTGLLQKFWKLIVFGIAGLAAAARKLFARRTPPDQPEHA